MEQLVEKTSKVLKKWGYPQVSDSAEEILAVSASIKASQDLRLRGTFAIIGALSLIAHGSPLGEASRHIILSHS